MIVQIFKTAFNAVSISVNFANETAPILYMSRNCETDLN